MSAAWYQVSCNVPMDIADSVAEYLADLSGCGVCTENRNVDAFSPDEIPLLQKTTITGYFPVPCPIEDHLARLESFLVASTEPHASVLPPVLTKSIISEEDWANSWKDLFKPLETGRRLLITPSWLPPEQPVERIVITIDPGMAFGTGGHETTRLCLECVEKIADSRPELFLAESGASAPMLDLGTGSGILAIAAAKMGATTVDAVDIDPQAVKVATENCILNQVEKQVRCCSTPIEQLGSGYGIILANILAEELVRLAPAIMERLSGDGELVLSGILAEREDYVIEGFRPYPLELVQSSAAGEWRCLHYSREK